MPCLLRWLLLPDRKNFFPCRTTGPVSYTHLRAICDKVIDNNGLFEDTKRQIETILRADNKKECIKS